MKYNQLLQLTNDIKSPRVEYFLWVGGDFTGVHPALGLAHVGQPEHHQGAGAHHGLKTLGIFCVQQLRILPVEGKEHLGKERYFSILKLNTLNLHILPLSKPWQIIPNIFSIRSNISSSNVSQDKVVRMIASPTYYNWQGRINSQPYDIMA